MKKYSSASVEIHYDGWDNRWDERHRQRDDFASPSRASAQLHCQQSSHNSSCLACKEGGANLLMCEGCERVCHLACCGLKAVPKGDWYCKVCMSKNRVPPGRRQTQTADSSSNSRPPQLTHRSQQRSVSPAAGGESNREEEEEEREAAGHWSGATTPPRASVAAAAGDRGGRARRLSFSPAPRSRVLPAASSRSPEPRVALAIKAAPKGEHRVGADGRDSSPRQRTRRSGSTATASEMQRSSPAERRGADRQSSRKRARQEEITEPATARRPPSAAPSPGLHASSVSSSFSSFPLSGSATATSSSSSSLSGRSSSPASSSAGTAVSSASAVRRARGDLVSGVPAAVSSSVRKRVQVQEAKSADGSSCSPPQSLPADAAAAAPSSFPSSSSSPLLECYRVSCRLRPSASPAPVLSSSQIPMCSFPAVCLLEAHRPLMEGGVPGRGLRPRAAC